MRSYFKFYTTSGARCGAMVEALRYKQEGCGFDSGWCHWNFSLTIFPALELTQPLTEMSTRNISLGVKAAGA